MRSIRFHNPALISSDTMLGSLCPQAGCRPESRFRCSPVPESGLARPDHAVCNGSEVPGLCRWRRDVHADSRRRESGRIPARKTQRRVFFLQPDDLVPHVRFLVERRAAASVLPGAIESPLRPAEMLVRAELGRHDEGDATLVPIEMAWPSMTQGAPIVSTSRWASRAAASGRPASCWMTANSSPPSRAARSASTMHARRRSATATSRASRTGWPSVSLTCLNRSRSRLGSAPTEPVRARAIACSRRSHSYTRLPRPVRASWSAYARSAPRSACGRRCPPARRPTG